MVDLSTEVKIFLKTKIFLLDGISYILDRDLAGFYGMETRIFNQAVKRNLHRFDSSFIIQLTKEQVDTLLIGRSGSGSKSHLPYAFTFEGTVLLCGFLNSDVAIEKAKYVAKEFVRLKLLQQNESKFTNYDIETIKNNFVSKEEFNFFVEKMLEIIDTKKIDSEKNTIGFKIQ